MAPAEGALDPPTKWDTYLVDGYGSPAAPGSGPVFVVMHSGRGSTQAVGNAIVDRASGSPSLAAGTAVEVDGVPFEVIESRVTAKDGLHDECDLWDGEYDLVVITCQQYADGSPSKLALTFAQRH
jgi:hypothetical protein